MSERIQAAVRAVLALVPPERRAEAGERLKELDAILIEDFEMRLVIEALTLPPEGR